VAGGVAGFGLVQLAGSYLEAARAPGAWILAGSAGVLMAAAVIASAVPASRAARVDVVQALRSN